MTIRSFSLIVSSIVILIAPLGMAEAESPDPRTRLEQALESYAAAQGEADRDERIAHFAQAEAGFAAVVESGVENAALLTNLGNAALQAEHVGSAVLAYRRALRLDADAATARQNLVHVRGLLPSWVPRPDSSERLASLYFYRRVSPASRSAAAAACFAFAAACLALSIRRSEGAWRGLALTGAMLWALLLASVIFDPARDDERDAVVTAPEALARSADSRLAALAFPEPLPVGVEVEILEERADWVRVRLYNGREVWLRRSSVTRVGG